ncbi:MAG: EAL domain-containing protein [Methylococcaceae bacterium]
MNQFTQQNSINHLWGYSLVFFFLGVVSYLLTRYYRNYHRLQHNNAHLEQLVQTRTQALQSVIEELKRDIEQGKQTEQQLLVIQARQRAIFDAQPDALLISNAQGIIVMVSHQVERLLGYKNEELIGQAIEFLIPEAIRTDHRRYRELCSAAPYTRLLCSGFSSICALHKNGNTVEVEISLSPIQTEQGLLFASALHDMTQRKQTESLLKSSEEHFRVMANNSPMMIWITNKEGKPLFANQAWLEFVGLDSKKGIMSHEQWCNAVHPDDRETAFTSYYNNENNHQSIITEYRLRHVSNEWRWVLDQSMPMFDNTGALIGYIGSLIDITARKQLEAELRIAATAFESHEAMVITDANSVILRVNSAFTEVTGYSSAEAVGNKMNLLRSGRHDNAFYENMWASIQKTGSWQGEIWDRRKNGEIYPKWLTITAVTDDKGIITHYVGTQSDITERKAAEKKIRHLAYYDPLTQLPNRRLLQERLEHAIANAHREQQQLALLMLDLDRFKAVNDSFGHLAGDELLQKVAIRLSSHLRGVDSIARLGGDEFIVLLENIVHSEDAARLAQSIITDLSKPFQLSQSDNVCIGVSIGISLYPQHGNNATQLIEQADAALYQAKEKGRCCFAYFSDELTRLARERMTLESRLRIAIKEQQLRVFYQAQTDIATGRIIGAEALVRWQDPINGLISPNQFISIAEESGLINALGEWVLRETCRQGRQWLNAGLPPLNLAVNVSPQQFKRIDMPALIKTILQDTDFPAQQLELEITENGLMDYQDRLKTHNLHNEQGDNVVETLNKLRDLGVRLAIDDFGTGYSSLLYLKHFPLNSLKIDKGFIDNIPYNQNDIEIAATIIAMARILGFKVLAEGVETIEQLAFLQEKGCDSYQGYLKSKPLSADAFTHLLNKQMQDNSANSIL